jgi:hypothetical protein
MTAPGRWVAVVLMHLCRRLGAGSEERKEGLCSQTAVLFLPEALVTEQFAFRPRALIYWLTYTFTLHIILVPTALHECEPPDDENERVGRL